MAESLRVALVAGPATGGIRGHVSRLAIHLADRGWPVAVVAPATTLQPLRSAADSRIDLVEADIGSSSPPRSAVAVLRMRRAAGAADVVHAHGLRPAALAALAGVRPLVATWHNAPLTAGPALRLHARLERVAAIRAAVTLAVSPDLAERARLAGARDVRLIEVPSGQSSRPSGRSREEVRRELGLPGERPVVLAVARLDRQKAIDVLSAAASGWTGPKDPVVVVAGDGPERSNLIATAAVRQGVVRLLGERGDVPDLLAAADLVVLPSRWEGWPLAAAEALAAGRPLVASDLPGIRRLAGDAALYVTPDSAASVRDTVQRALADPAGLVELGRRGIERSAEWLTLDAANDRLLAIYRNLHSTSSLQ